MWLSLSEMVPETLTWRSLPGLLLASESRKPALCGERSIGSQGELPFGVVDEDDRSGRSLDCGRGSLSVSNGLLRTGSASEVMTCWSYDSKGRDFRDSVCCE